MKRSRDRVLTGVLSGIAEYLGISPRLVRIIYVLAGIPNPLVSTLLYIVLTAIIPEY